MNLISGLTISGDYEIFDLVDELEKIEGKEVDFYSWLNVEVCENIH